MAWEEEYDVLATDALEKVETELEKEYEKLSSEYREDRGADRREEREQLQKEYNQCYTEWCYVETLLEERSEE